MYSSVRPSRAPVAAADSRARTVVVPTATTRLACWQASQVRDGHRVPLRVHRVALDLLVLYRPERAQPDGQVEMGDGRPTLRRTRRALVL